MDEIDWCQLASTTSIHTVRMYVLAVILNPGSLSYCSKNGGYFHLFDFGNSFLVPLLCSSSTYHCHHFQWRVIDFARVFMGVPWQIVINNSLMFTSCWYVCGWPSMHHLCISWKSKQPLLSSCLARDFFLPLNGYGVKAH